MDEEWIVNRYQLQETIGQGAMGTVYRAVDARLGGVTRAIKFLAQTLQSLEMCDRFEQEARISAQLSSRTDYIVLVTDYGLAQDSTPFYVMQYLQGTSLRERMHPYLSLPDFLNLSQQICLGLQCAHEGIQLRGNEPRYPVIHCDLKPSNIFVISEPMRGETVRILDFGIASLFTSSNSQEQGFQGGTPPYCSPEQLRGEVLDPRSDLYSLGILMFEMLTGRLPFTASNIAGWRNAHSFQTPPSLTQIAPKRAFPQPLEDLILRCLAKRPSDRPHSAAEIFEILRDIGTPFNVQLPRDLPVEPPTSQAADANSPVTPPQEQGRSPSLLAWQGPIRAGRIIAQPLFSGPESLASIRCMLPHELIQTIQIHQQYNRIKLRFRFVDHPHPMLLWLTALCIPNRRAPVFLPVYLDLHHSPMRRLTQLLSQKRLSQQGIYQVLFFDLEPPNSCSHTLSVMVQPKQCDRLQWWIMQSYTLRGGSPDVSRQLLQEEYENLRHQIEDECNEDEDQSNQ
jgi:serine/threonine protein kinase